MNNRPELPPTNEPGICIYHGDCLDGFGAAWVVWGKYPNWKYCAASYSGHVPNVNGMHVFIVDYSYPAEVIQEMSVTALSVTVIDHHKSAIKDLTRPGLQFLPSVTLVLDTTASGAMLTWHYLNDVDIEVPQVLLHIQDRDLWEFSIPCTVEVTSALYSYPLVFDVWDTLIDAPIADLIIEGSHIRRDHREKIMRHLEDATCRGVIAGFDVPVINAPHFMGSDLCDELCRREPFAAYYWDGATSRNFGLRSDKHGEDVSVIAGMFGGGGHEHAAGFKRPLEKICVGETE